MNIFKRLFRKKPRITHMSVDVIIPASKHTVRVRYFSDKQREQMWVKSGNETLAYKQVTK